MVLITLEFVSIILLIIVGLLALSGAIVCINFAWNLFKSVLNIKE